MEPPQPLTFSDAKLDSLILSETEWVPILDDIFTGSKIVAIFGARGKGKTALGLRIGELADQWFRRPVSVMNMDPELLPEHWTVVSRIDEVPTGYIVIVDEAETVVHSRRALARANVRFMNIGAISRHKDLSIVLISQASNFVDLALIQLADYVFLKEPGALSVAGERWVLHDLISYAKFWFARIPEELRPQYFVTFSDRYYTWLIGQYAKFSRYVGLEALQRYLLRHAIIKGKNNLPSFWSDRLSKLFRDWSPAGRGKRSELEAVVSEVGNVITAEDVMRILNVSKSTAYRRIDEWKSRGILKKVGRGRYEVLKALPRK